MFIQSLTITENGKDRHVIKFHKGMNLIVNETGQAGNGAGKTTLLRMIDYCLGMPTRPIYQDHDHRKKDNARFASNFKLNKVKLTLRLVDNLDNPTYTIEIERMVTDKKDSTCCVNGKTVEASQLQYELRNMLYPDMTSVRPTLVQLVSHNIRHTDVRLRNTIDTLGQGHSHFRDYECLYLYMLGLSSDNASSQAEMLTTLEKEHKEMSALERTSSIEMMQERVHGLLKEFHELEEGRKRLNVNEHLDEDIAALDEVRLLINQNCNELEGLKMRRSIIQATIDDYTRKQFRYDTKQLEEIYTQAGQLNLKLAHTFGQMVEFHNSMLRQRESFAKRDLPDLEQQIDGIKQRIGELTQDEERLAERIYRGDTYDTLQYTLLRQKEIDEELAEAKRTLQKMERHSDVIRQLEAGLKQVRESLYSPKVTNDLQDRVSHFNRIYQALSVRMFDGDGIDPDDMAASIHMLGMTLGATKGLPCYRFNPVRNKYGHGVTKAEIASFDIAYTQYADQQRIPCMHFLLYDQFESLGHTYMRRLYRLVSESNTQCIMAILKEKLPEELQRKEDIVLEVSEDNPLMGWPYEEENLFTVGRRTNTDM